MRSLVPLYSIGRVFPFHFQHSPGVASKVLGVACGRPRFRYVVWNAIAGLCATCQILQVCRFLRGCAVFGIPAGERSPRDLFLWKRPLRSRLIDFCAGGGRFRKRTSMLFSFTMSFCPQSLHLQWTTASALEKLWTK